MNLKSTLKKLGYAKVHKQMNDVFLKYTAKVVFLIIITFSINLFFSGHYSPGGGFVGGLLAAAAIVLLLLAYDLKTINKMIPFDHKWLIALGLTLRSEERRVGKECSSLWALSHSTEREYL